MDEIRETPIGEAALVIEGHDESDVFLEFAGDWYITPQFAAGLSVEFGGDFDLWTIGARYYFK